VSELTARELEVQKLVAEGLSNAEIVKELYVSETTARHSSPDEARRARPVQAVVVAYECGLADQEE
jgi:FixJ family two-component response regulator